MRDDVDDVDLAVGLEQIQAVVDGVLSKVSPSKVEFSDSIPRGEAKFYRMVVQD